MAGAGIVLLGKPVRPSVNRLAGWMKPGPNSMYAHRIKTAGSKFLVTACSVALLRSQAAEATTATMRCFECMELERGSLTPMKPVDYSQGKGGGNKRPKKEPEAISERGRELQAAHKKAEA